MPDALIALGSNLGDRAATLDQAAAALARLPRTQLIARSRWHVTRPVGGPAGQSAFLNGAVRVATTLPAEQLHRRNQQIELAANRTRIERWAARTLDVDLLLYGDALIRTDQLEVPHPRMSFRRFVLQGAREIAGDMQVPQLGWTVAQLWRRLCRGPELAVFVGKDVARSRELARRIAEQFNCQMKSDDSSATARTGQPAIAVLSQNDARKADAKLSVYLDDEYADPNGRGATLSGKLCMVGSGPTLRMGRVDFEEAYREAAAAMLSVWPAL